jgi:SNF2 family DNA or RNA helicase
VDAEVTARIALTLTSKLLQLASGSVFDDGKTPRDIHDAKLDNLESLLNELNGENVIVVYNFTHESKRIQERFPHAQIYRGKKQETDWNAGCIPLLLLQPQAGGHGTNLQHGGRTMVFFSPLWDLELRLQVAERIGPVRQAQAGYDRAVLHYDIVAKDTLDEEVLERLVSKRSVQEALMSARAHRA